MSVNLGSTYKEVVDEINASSKRIDDLEDGIGTKFDTLDKTLSISEERVLKVNTANTIEEGNKLPVTSAAVYEIFRMLEEI